MTTSPANKKNDIQKLQRAIVDGLEDVADYPKITEALLKAGYTKADLEKIWSGNVLRVLKAAEVYAAGVKG